MLKLTVAGTTYEYPEPGEDPQWGLGPTQWAEAVTQVLNTVLGPGDILETTFSIDNNVTVPQNINGFLFDSGTVRGADLTATVYRTSNTNPAGHSEITKMTIVYDDDAPVGEKWKLVQQTNGAAGIVFAITDVGQLTYMSSNIGSIGYSGSIHFKAAAIRK
jgi:hypothetical protein